MLGPYYTFLHSRWVPRVTSQTVRGQAAAETRKTIRHPIPYFVAVKEGGINKDAAEKREKRA